MCAPAAAVDSAAIIAESAKARLTVADYEAELAKLPPAARAEFAASELRLKQYLDTLYTNRVLAADARSEGLDRDPVLARQIATAVDKLLAQAMVERIEARAVEEVDTSIERFTARAREMYMVNPAKYAHPEQVRVSRILITVGKDGDTAALARITDIRAKALGGVDFKELARQESADPLAVKTGGDTGFTDARTMDPAFREAAFALKTKGDISAPIRTRSGYEIILLLDRRPAGTRSFEEVKPELIAGMKARAQEDARADAVRKIFSDPTLKVDAGLIDRIHAEAAIKADASKVAAPKN